MFAMWPNTTGALSTAVVCFHSTAQASWQWL